MRIGDSVTYDGRTYIAVGFTPISVLPPEIQLYDPWTGTTIWVGWPPAEAVERAALRLASESPDERAEM
jgi:hypothetical protein